MIELPEGFKIEKVASGLNFPTSLTWDNHGRMYVAEGGGGLGPPNKQVGPIRILRVEPSGKAEEVVNLEGTGVSVAMVGMTWHEGAFYVTHRAAEDFTGAVSRVTPDGQVTRIFDGIIDSQAEHQINDIQMGPDGKMYVAVGLAGNAAVMGPDLAGHIKLSPNVHSTPCQDIVLTGRNFKSPDFRTEQEGDSVLTGAYVPFGTQTQPGQVIEGVNKCGGSILAFDPENAEATVGMHAWGFRNLIGLTWDDHGQMYATQNGFDIRGSRPVDDVADPTFRIREGEWYGHPDFSATRQPLTDERFEVADSFQAPIFVDGQFIGKDLGFVIDHEASGLDAPEPSLLAGLHEFHSSPSLLDAAPASWSSFAGQLFVAEWGDLAPVVDPTFNEKAGFRVVRVDPASQQVMPFVRNQRPGPASMQGAQGEGLEHPFDVKFGPDGAMYIVDYGVVELNPMAMFPFEQKAGTGVIWKVTRAD